MTDNPIEALRTGWGTALPDLDVAPMLTMARVNRLAILLRHQLSAELAKHDSSLADFDVLSALRRQGPPYSMKPSQLAESLLLSPSGMTNRVDRLEESGLLERSLDPNNRRTLPVALTPSGVKKADQLVALVVETERALLTRLSATNRRQLDQLLDTLLEGFSAER